MEVSHSKPTREQLKLQIRNLVADLKYRIPLAQLLADVSRRDGNVAMQVAKLGNIYRETESFENKYFEGEYGDKEFQVKQEEFFDARERCAKKIYEIIERDDEESFKKLSFFVRLSRKDCPEFKLLIPHSSLGDSNIELFNPGYLTGQIERKLGHMEQARKELEQMP